MRKVRLTTKEEVFLAHEDNGLDLFKNFFLIQLKWQQRLKHDPCQAALVEKMTKGEPLQMSDIDRLKTLSKSDIDIDEEWHSAPIMVTSNRETIDLTAQSTPRLAELKNEHVIRWPLIRKRWKNKPNLNFFSDVQDDPAIWGYFVCGEPGYLAHTINPKIKLSNGALVQFYSLFYHDKSKQQEKEEKIRNTPIGQVITMLTPLMP
eukprot:10672947-Ditylum_brightwellii.AAC.1